MRILKVILLVNLLLVVTHLFAAATSSPTIMLQQMSNQAIAALKQEKAKLPAGQTISLQTMHRIVNDILLPHVNLDDMSKAVLGRNIWQNATAAQQTNFKIQFTDLVVNTYASALKNFDKDEVKFYPIRGGYAGNSTVEVNSAVNAPNAAPLPVVYHLENKNGTWLIYDLSVDGISLVETYKAQFGAMVQQDGLDNLIQTLAAHNKALMEQSTGNS